LKKIIILSLILFLMGCATPRPQLSREEWLAVSSRNYEGVTKDQALNAAEKLFRLADGDDFKIVHTEDGLYATRNWGAYMVIAFVAGTDYWQVKVTPTNNGIKAFVQVNTQSQGAMPMTTTDGAMTATMMPMSGSPVEGTAIYDVFWSRMDYLLGKRPDWMNCHCANERVKQGIVWGTNEALCNSFNMKDETPSAPILSYRDPNYPNGE